MDDYEETGALPMKVILPASDIPVGATVTKRTGEVEYLLKDEIKIYTRMVEGSAPQVIKGEGVLYLIGERGDISAVSSSITLCWVVDEDDLLDWLEERVEGTSR